MALTPSARHKALIIYAVLAALVGAYLLYLAMPVINAKVMHDYPYDGKVDWIAARAWWDGKDPYSAASCIA